MLSFVFVFIATDKKQSYSRKKKSKLTEYGVYKHHVQRRSRLNRDRSQVTALVPSNTASDQVF